MRSIAAPICVLLAATAQAAAPPVPLSPKAAVEKALKRVEAGVRNYPRHRQCFSCHHQAMAVLSVTAARDHGFAVDAGLLERVTAFSLRTFRNRALVASGRGVGGDSTSVVYALHTFAAAGRPYDDTTAALLNYLVVKQRRDGAWPIPARGDRPPTMGSLFTNTGLALSALKRHPPPEADKDLRRRVDAAFSKGAAWLLANKPSSNEDRVFHLWGLVAADAGAKVVDPFRDALLAQQRPDGSWAQLRHMQGDAYATATALVALRKAGLSAGHAAYQRGVGYLLRTQRDDGAWLVQTRSRPLQVFFDNGDPGGKSQFISFAATGWAVLALLEAVPADRSR